jgi:phytoene synthase
MNSQQDIFLEIHNSIDYNKITEHPNILIAANFWEQERYCAAKTCYKFMRLIDDMIDDHKSKNKLIAPHERKEFTASVNNWLKIIILSEECNPLQLELIETVKKFRIPVWPLEAFAKSMIYDINNNGFPDIDSFLEYSNGASVAPASVFVHLNGLRRNGESFEDPLFDVKQAATPCAIFSYLVHIIRDFQKDQLNNLTYFADDQLAKNNLTREDLREFAEGRPVSDSFRELIKHYYAMAEEYKHKTIDVLKNIKPLHEPRYQLSLEVIFDLYLMVFERIDLNKGQFTAEELNPTPEETRERVYRRIVRF